jgi:S-adenosylmethionine-diacylgycerolhomoserine-N-methlytransferase
MIARSASTSELMDGIYRGQRHIYDLTRRPYLLGRSDMLKALQPPVGGYVLEIGCGTAWNLIRAAQLYPHAHFFGLDVSALMLQTAHGAISRRGLLGRIRLANADASDFNADALFGRARFDRVFISYALSMIPDWQLALARALGAVADGGVLHIIDFGPCHALPTAFRKLLFAWLALFSVTPRLALPATLRALCAGGDVALTVTALRRGYGIGARVSRLPIAAGAVPGTLVPTAAQ